MTLSQSQALNEQNDMGLLRCPLQERWWVEAATLQVCNLGVNGGSRKIFKPIFPTKTSASTSMSSFLLTSFDHCISGVSQWTQNYDVDCFLGKVGKSTCTFARQVLVWSHQSSREVRTAGPARTFTLPPYASTRIHPSQMPLRTASATHLWSSTNNIEPRHPLQAQSRDWLTFGPLVRAGPRYHKYVTVLIRLQYPRRHTLSVKRTLDCSVSSHGATLSIRLVSPCLPGLGPIRTRGGLPL